MYISGLPTCMSVCSMHAWYLQISEGGLRSPGTGVTEGCDLPWGCWEATPGLLQEQALLISQPSFQPLIFLLYLLIFKLILSICLHAWSQDNVKRWAFSCCHLGPSDWVLGSQDEQRVPACPHLSCSSTVQENAWKPKYRENFLVSPDLFSCSKL